MVTEVYIGKTQKLSSDSAKPSCTYLYNNALGDLNKISKTSEAIITSGLGESQKNELMAYSELLSDKNKEMVKFSCSLIY